MQGKSQAKKMCGLVRQKSILDIKFRVEVNPLVLDIIALVNSAPEKVVTKEKRAEMLDFLIPLSAEVTAGKKRFMQIRIDKEPL